PGPGHGQVCRGARDVPFDGGGAPVQEQLAVLLLRRIQELLGSRDRGNRLIEPWLCSGLGPTRNGEPGKDGKKNPCSNDGTPGHLCSFDHTDLGGERFRSLRSVAKCCQAKSPASRFGKIGSSSSNSASSPASARPWRRRSSSLAKRPRWSSVRRTA